MSTAVHPGSQQIVNLILSDIGRPIAHIVTNLIDYSDLVVDTRTVLDTLAPVTREVCIRNGLCYKMSIMPYRTTENVIMGAVITTALCALKK